MLSSPQDIKKFTETQVYQDYLNEAQLWYDRALQEQQEALKKGDSHLATFLAGCMQACKDFKDRMFEVLENESENGKDYEDADEEGNR